jgi:hypothetical protein
LKVNEPRALREWKPIGCDLSEVSSTILAGSGVRSGEHVDHLRLEASGDFLISWFTLSPSSRDIVSIMRNPSSGAFQRS